MVRAVFLFQCQQWPQNFKCPIKAISVTLLLAETYGFVQFLFFSYQAWSPTERTSPPIERYPSVDIMVPLVGTVKELEHQIAMIRETASAVFEEKGVVVAHRVGTMIEIPRAALLSDAIASAGAEFFSFGTNDLTQMTFGYSRDDVSKFLPTYLEQGILKHDPFQVLDQEGVGQLIEMSVTRGRAARPDLKVGICGEHGGDPASVDFFHRQKLDYVSCSPFRVPIARLAAAQAALKERSA